MTIKVKSSFIVLQMYFNSLTLCLFWKKIDTNAPIHSNNQKSWFYSFFLRKGRRVLYVSSPPSQNVFKSGELLLETISCVKTTCWENKRVCRMLKTSFFSLQPQMTIFQLQNPPKENWCSGQNFHLNTATGF